MLETFNKEAPEIADIQIKLSPEDFKSQFFMEMQRKYRLEEGEPIDKNSVLGKLMRTEAPLEALEKGRFEDLVTWIEGSDF